ncbi:MAG TPA: hypothetical protein VHG91_12895, partial [Longimicrobium sp.]|nr:hypothetical protein [Longimicrobium sp.]
MRPADAQQVVAALLASPDVSEIFVRGFRWLLAPAQHAVFGSHPHDRRRLARRSAEFRRLRDAFRDQLSGVSLSTPASTVLGRFAFAKLERTLREGLEEAAGPRDVLGVVLALLEAIDRGAGKAVVSAFYGDERDAPVPLAHDRAFPRPWPPFGTHRARRAARPPITAVPVDYVRLEEYFSHLAVARHDTAREPSPMLLRGRRHLGRKKWRVAMVSVLSDFWDVEWRAEGHWFSGARLAEGARERVVARLRWALDRCQKERADLVLLPELTVDDGLREVIQGWLEQVPRGDDDLFPLVVFGGVHEPAEGADGRFRNRPWVLRPGADRAAQALAWDYAKSEPLVGAFPGRPGEYTEALLREPGRVVAMDTPLGRVALVVCKDFLMDDCRVALSEMRYNVLLVVSMTNARSIGAFLDTARALAGGTGAVTVFCNSSIHHREEERARLAAALERASDP